jgi:uncharacterized membrane protein YeaQ/YmgE (transglycosylase-associated protein family)
MSFSMFVTWVLLGVLAGVLAGLVAKRGGYGLKTDIVLGLVGSIGLSWIFRAVGVFPDAGIVAMAFVAFIGAAIAIAAQRKLRPTEQPGETMGGMGTIWRWGLGAALAATVVWMTLGPSGQPAATAAPVVDDKTYAVTPAALKVKAGIVTGEVTDMKVTERVEQGSGRVVSPAKLTANLWLKNSSGNQTVRLVAGKIQYIDTEGNPIKLEGMRVEPALRFGTTGSEQLDPGQQTIQSLDVDFPAEALKARKLKEIRLELAYIPSPYHQETVNFPVSIGGR